MPQAVTQVYKLADTNLAGVTAIRWSKETADAPLSHSESIASDLLGPLDHTNVRVAALHRRLLSREWPDDARIVPRLAPQVGVTHDLAPRRRVADTAFTSNNWSGSTIPGTWAHAVGIWRVPTVGVPSTPAGTDGGWDSSSFLGGHRRNLRLQRRPPGGHPAIRRRRRLDDLRGTSGLHQRSTGRRTISSRPTSRTCPSNPAMRCSSAFTIRTAKAS